MTDKGEMKRRTKHGDPLSILLFNIVLQMALKDDVTRWQKTKGMGICLGDSESDCFTNLRFADDVLLFSTSQVQLQKMMCDFKQSTERVGLKIHPDKTKILSNQSSNRRKEVAINNMSVEILPACESAKYLGQTKQEPTSKSYFLQDRLCLFNMVITPTLSHTSGTWALSREHERMIRSTQRTMLKIPQSN